MGPRQRARPAHVLGLRVLALEWFARAERTALVVATCVAAGLAVGLLFLLGGA